jgi:hypothetical protein
MGREYVEDARRTGLPPDFSVQLRIQTAVGEMPFTSIRCIGEARHTLGATVVYILREVLSLVSDDHKADRVRQALMLLATLAAAETEGGQIFGLAMSPGLCGPTRRLNHG